MLIKVNGITNKFLKRFVEHCVYLIIVLILIPAFFYFELCVVLPAVVEEWTISYFIHLFCAHFLLLNIIGNLIYGMFTNTSICGRYLDKYNKSDWTFCSVCECDRPPRAWHCSICDICILKRDHHCTFLACCVGYYNQRYFILFTFYIFVSMLYAFYFNVQFVSKFITWNHGLVLVKFIFPLASFAIDFSNETLYVFLVVINFLVALFTGFLFFYHFKNLLKGRIVYEKNNESIDGAYDRGWKLNIMEVFGINWYLAWFLPFINSPMLGNGIDWSDINKLK